MRVVVIGAGVGGLAAAHDLARRGHRPVVLEAEDRVGGKLYRREVGGVTVDVGAEAMLHRRPEGGALASELGLTVEHPTAASSRIWTRGRLRPLPRSLMGVPMDLAALEASGILSDAGLARVRQEPDLPVDELPADVAVGDLVARRFGEEVTDRLVEPLLGGVYAGHARQISAAAAVPQLLAMARRGPLLAQAAAVPSTGGPVFAGLPGGMGRLTEALAADERVTVRTGARVVGLARRERGFALTLTDEQILADAVVVATPAAAAAGLLGDLAPSAAVELGAIEYAAMAVITLVFRRSEVAGAALDGSLSGLLVPPRDGRRIKAATFSFAKWDWVRRAGEADGLIHLRTSIGRAGEEKSLAHPDEELVAHSLADLGEATGLTAAPVATHVQRWDAGLPQYAVGHLDRVARIRADVARVPGLEICGAAYDGVGVPAVIGTAHAAVARLLESDPSHEITSHQKAQ
ncbi:protoporphyrinogen oxidase [Nocardioides insulae]|uniref:protoporphyrinogen oxidase n=1 Tax=Nocardioides insulae TaxID=394734 RepID=UPI000688F7C3|nr:protoporphyrinogen oxidase [Nocardioides insulae]